MHGTLIAVVLKFYNWVLATELYGLVSGVCEKDDWLGGSVVLV